MSLFNIMDEISEKQIMKTETGDARIFGVMLGIVAKNYDKDMPGRVCVTIPVRDQNANELKWARVASMSGGEKWGQYFLPEIGDQVLIVFENGNIEKPYVIGCIPRDNSQFTAGTVDEKNQLKKIQTKNGSRIEFFDNKEGDGKKDRISVITPEDALRLDMDNEKKTISVSDKDKKNTAVMNTGDGSLEINAEKKLTLKIGSSITVTCDGSSGTVKVDAKKVEIDGSTGISISSGSKVEVKGTNVEETATAGMKLSSSASMKIEGAIINIG